MVLSALPPSQRCGCMCYLCLFVPLDFCMVIQVLLNQVHDLIKLCIYRLCSCLASHIPAQCLGLYLNLGQLACEALFAELHVSTLLNVLFLCSGLCIITYWRHQNWLGAVPCPSCRTQVRNFPFFLASFIL